MRIILSRKKNKHIICFSGGHASALVAIEVVRKYGKDNVILLNHDINKTVEHEDIKRFKKEVAEYLGIEITFANHPEVELKDQFDVCIDEKSFVTKSKKALCTTRLKTDPFVKWLNENFPEEKDKKYALIYYGFTRSENNRILRRSSAMALKGFKTVFPLAHWGRTIFSTEEINIKPPLTYNQFKHANCVGCLKAGQQHWYVVFCTRKDIWEKAKQTEEMLGYSIVNNFFLEELEPKFKLMEKEGVPPTEQINYTTFWNEVKTKLNINEDSEKEKPCECIT